MSDRQSAPIWLAAAVLTGALVRIAAAIALSENLSHDRDIYLALADGLAEGRGYSVPGSTRPTAFRTPLYPLLLALPGLRSPGGVAALQIALGAGTILITYALARRLGLSRRRASVAAMLVAVDPMLVLYSTQPMTEVPCAFLVTGLLCVLVTPAGSGPVTPLRCAAVGVLMGLAALCRPTVWAYGAMLACWWCIRQCRSRQPANEATGGLGALQRAGILVLGLGVVVAPWVIRNTIVMGRPILTTTHGGYTLLLGNNPAYYREVVDQPLGTIWDGSHGPGQAAWAAQLNHEMDALNLHSETERDRWMSRQAGSYILADPAHFARASVIRALRFWSIKPAAGADAGVPRPIIFGVAAFYLGLFAAAIGGFVGVLRRDRTRWMPLVLLIPALALVHLVYWTDARMRAPVMPALAALAACVG
jgi:hypothetical protein